MEAKKKFQLSILKSILFQVEGISTPPGMKEGIKAPSAWMTGGTGAPRGSPLVVESEP